MSRQKGTNVPNQPTVPPIPPIQKMRRYIDADKLLNTICDKGLDCDALMIAISEQPTADVRENAKGRWIEYPDCLKYDGAIMQEDFVCSECKAVFSAIDNEGERFNYCPNCGARMENKNDIS